MQLIWSVEREAKNEKKHFTSSVGESGRVQKERGEKKRKRRIRQTRIRKGREQKTPLKRMWSTHFDRLLLFLWQLETPTTNFKCLPMKSPNNKVGEKVNWITKNGEI
ncbi:hypothetical protein NPIL_672081 [Nephila pilipes]|uniref:Uncharacterized protein n=1 Tax=Nephila pilipes TaxID=299642 RepID=A0A8X6NSD3_NEPPI|nr:hypothetical protein NPIL_672081 [Nephila pilipes]